MIFSFQHESERLGAVRASGKKEGRRRFTDGPSLRGISIQLHWPQRVGEDSLSFSLEWLSPSSSVPGGGSPERSAGGKVPISQPFSCTLLFNLMLLMMRFWSYHWAKPLGGCPGPCSNAAEM